MGTQIFTLEVYCNIYYINIDVEESFDHHHSTPGPCSRLWDLGNSQVVSPARILSKRLFWANIRPLSRKVPGQQLFC